MIDRLALLADLRPVLAVLEDEISARVESTPPLEEHLQAEYAKALVAERTAMALPEWREGEITQAAVAWVLACVFVRFLEDNKLIDAPLLSGPDDRRAAALGHRDEYFRSFPEHSDREFLEQVFREVARHPPVAPLFDEDHNPLWILGPQADGATALLAFWSRLDPDSGALLHDFTDPQLDTRFLGDLYQDLSDAAKKRYALLQTPIFIEEFILDRTLDPAIAEFGLEQVRMIDPTCGSGHFLIGSFQRLFAQWQRREPGTTITVLARRALHAVHGVDLNPYATAIARFRLLIAALRACDIGRLAEAPPFELNLATGDSLLHGARTGQLFGGAAANDRSIAHVFETEDAAELRRILGQGYHAVVGNPPYIAVSDSALRSAYRRRYESCHGKYVLTVPFMERFFELACPEAPGGRVLAGFVGKITGNNFMKREFGVRLVERFLPSVDLQTVIDAGGAPIPGHGTPTVLLFGRSRAPVSTTLRVLDGIRGEPPQLADPARGEVWSSIVRLVDAPGEQDEFMRSSDIPRMELLTHPMTLGIGRELRKRLERQIEKVGTLSESVGITSFTLEDDIFIVPRVAVRRRGIELAKPIVEGDGVRDWFADTPSSAIFPYDVELKPVSTDRDAGWWRHLWRARTNLAMNVMFAGKTKVEAGLAWYEFGRLTASKLRTPLTITWGEVATHNHFVLDRGGKVFKQTAPVIKLPEGATETEHLALLGALNSSTACFWLKQVCHNKGSTVDDQGTRQRTAPFEDFYQYNATKVRALPLPSDRPLELPRTLDHLASERVSLLDGLASIQDDTPMLDYLTHLQARDADLLGRMIGLQEELDWQMLGAYGLVADEPPILGADAPSIALGQRAFEIVLARQVAAGETETTWFARHGSTPITDVPDDWPPEYREIVRQRIALIESDTDIGLIERPEHKRRWAGRSWQERQSEALRTLVLDALEAPAIWQAAELRSGAQLADIVRSDVRLVEALEMLVGERDPDISATLQKLLLEEAVPHLAALRLNDKGLRKRATWEHVWELQRAEDRIDARCELPEEDPNWLTPEQAAALKAEQIGAIPVPARYAKPDFRSASTWAHRGKLDVPKERFILYPDAGRGADTSPVLSWAGWDERIRARALATRIVELREQDAADAARLTPLLAGIEELLPWIRQWYPDPDPEYSGTPGEFFEHWLDQQLAELYLPRRELRAWRAPPTSRRTRAKRVAA
jgi:Domain of unknown function (DUF7008)/Eco57I restriction-modification methylase